VELRPLPIDGAYEITTRTHSDARGTFAEWFRADELTSAGLDFTPRQGNVATSVHGTLRGIHFADVPPGQAKYVTCVSGRVADYVVDLRQGSPTYLATTSVELDAKRRNAVFLPEGVGHAYLALSDATVCYLVSSFYDPATEHTLNPFDERVGFEYPLERATMVLSDRDVAAPGLHDLEIERALPTWVDSMRSDK
jgi:dTDP-4-dehydrorhamnose 3,5-epimerase